VEESLHAGAKISSSSRWKILEIPSEMEPRFGGRAIGGGTGMLETVGGTLETKGDVTENLEAMSSKELPT
jgi:hypothetical protein